MCEVGGSSMCVGWEKGGGGVSGVSSVHTRLWWVSLGMARFRKTSTQISVIAFNLRMLRTTVRECLNVTDLCSTRCGLLRTHVIAS